MEQITEKVREHFQQPRNVGSLENADGFGEFYSNLCGDMMWLYLRIKDNTIWDIKYQTFGCWASIASGSALTEMVKGMGIEQAQGITKEEIIQYLGGLPEHKIHCSLLATDTLKQAIEDYRSRCEVQLYIQNQKIVATLHLHPSQSPCLITCHGYMSHRKSDKWIYVAHKFWRRGYAVLRFDFRGCGDSEGRFADSTLSRRIADLNRILQFTTEHPLLDGSRIGLVGSSLGGDVCLLTAAQLKEERIKGMVIWATPSRLLPQGGIFFEDAQKHDILEATKEIRCPLMIIHGHEDEEVNFRHALELYKRARPPKGLKIIKGGDHTFTNLIHRNTVIDITLNWLDKYL